MKSLKCLCGIHSYEKMNDDFNNKYNGGHYNHYLCSKCWHFKMELKKYPSYCCQKCGEHIGYLGRFVEFIYCGLIKHECKK